MVLILMKILIIYQYFVIYEKVQRVLCVQLYENWGNQSPYRLLKRVGGCLENHQNVYTRVISIRTPCLLIYTYIEESVISINELLSSPVPRNSILLRFRELSQLRPFMRLPTPLNRHSRNIWRSNNLVEKFCACFEK